MGYPRTARAWRTETLIRPVVMKNPVKTIPGSRLYDIFPPEGAWRGKRCFITAGGPSLKGFNYEVLKNELTIGINMSCLLYSPTLNYSMDIPLYNYITIEREGDSPEVLATKRNWKKYNGLKVWLAFASGKGWEKGVYLVDRINKPKVSLDLRNGIWGGNNSGLGALMLAVALGANPIYLLGYDMKVDRVNDVTHCHNYYKERQSTASTIGNRVSKFKEAIEAIAPEIFKVTSVINLNPDSALECFPKAPSLAGLFSH